MALAAVATPDRSAPDITRRPHVTALDGLRGLAVLAVLLFHGGKLRGGFLGVDLFFALSGYLITSLLLSEVDRTGGVDLFAFWARRFRRLLPAVLVMLVVITLVTSSLATVTERVAALNDGPWVQAYLANWHAISARTGYWASFDLPRVFGHLWSLAIEEQFYVVWPLVVLLVARRFRHVHRTVLVICAVVSALSLLQMIRLFDAADPTRVYIGTDTRLSGLLLGAMFATAPARAAVSRAGYWLRGRYNVAALVVVAAIAAAWYGIDGPSSPWLFHGGLFVHSLLSAALVAGCAAWPAAAPSRWLGWTPLRIVGEMSYSLYLWHWPIYALMSPQRTGMSSWTLLLARVAVSVAAAATSKVLIEDPVRFKFRWARGRRGVVSLVVASVTVAAFWVLVPHPSTAPAAFSPAQLTGHSTTSVTTAPASSVLPTTAPTTIAPTSAVVPTTIAPTIAPPTTVAPLAEATHKVMMVGDSMAFDEWPAVGAALTASNVAVDSFVAVGAGLLDTKFPTSVAMAKAVVESHPDLVLYQGSLWDFGTPDQQRLAYQRFTDVVLGTGARLVFITIPPLRSDQHNDLLATLPELMYDIADHNPGKVFVLDSTGAWGPVFQQDVNGDKTPERKPDGVHVCPSGAAMYAHWLLGELQRRFAGFVPAEPSVWAAGDWLNEPRYTTPPGICSRLP
jgi:peptidoglycan/LPS O-acetylase OafA/YrhL